MKDFLTKYKKVVIIILILLLFIGLLVGTYVLFLKDSSLFNKDSADTSTEVVEEKTVTPRPEYELADSDVVLSTTSAIALDWASDSKLYSCAGLPLSSIQYPDVTYYWLGASEGKYSNWLCEYFSKTKNASLMFGYKDGEAQYDLDDTVDGGDYAYMVYNNMPSVDIERVVKSSEIYDTLKDIVNEDDNYLKMYLADTVDYGFVWKVEESSMDDVNEYGINVLVHTYIVDLYTGAIKATLDVFVF